MNTEPKPTDALTNGASDGATLETIRDLLLAPEKEALAELRQRVDASQLSPDQLSELLPKSIDAARERNGELSRSLGPVIDGAITESIQRDPETLANAISPIMMPAIRRSVMQMVAGMAQSFNRTLEQSLSAKGIQWRIEAWRTGRAFSEVVMMRSLVYRVEQVFLIHRETGLLLAHVADSDVGVMDADMVSGMLTAIQDFVRDSFSDGKRELLNTMDCDEHDVFVEYGSKAILAAVVSGIAPPKLRSTISATLTNIHAKHATILADFVGDSAPFEATEPVLRECLASQTQAPPEKKGFVATYAWVVPVALAAAILLWGGFRWRSSRRLEAFANAVRLPETVRASYESGAIQLEGSAHDDWLGSLTARTGRLDWLQGIDRKEVTNVDSAFLSATKQLNHEPGIVVTEATRSGDRYKLLGLRDPLAREPSEVIAQAGLNDSKVQMTWASYQSLEPPIVQRRVEKVLDAPESVTLRWKNNTLSVAGSATDQWWRKAEPRAIALLGAPDQLDATELQITNPSLDKYLHQLRNEPGIVVDSVGWDDGRFAMSGRRDDFAANPTDLLRTCGLGPQDVECNWMTYVSDEPIVVKRRVRQKLGLPDTVVVDMQDNVVGLTGVADLDWLSQLPQKIQNTADIPPIEFDKLIPKGIEQLTALKDSISNTVIYFKANSVEISNSERGKLDRLQRQVNELHELGQKYHRNFTITIVGRTATKTPQKALSLERAKVILTELMNPQLNPEMFRTNWGEGDGVPSTTIDNLTQGRATFVVTDKTKSE